MNYTFKASSQLTLNVGANNLFDKAMVFSNSVYYDGYVQNLNDVVGRHFYVNARFIF